MKKIKWILIFILFSAVLIACTNKKEVEISNLQCEMLSNPFGIDISTPRLSWQITADIRNVVQTKYHILVASSLEKLNANEGDMWNSGSKNSDQTINIVYEGKKLESRRTYFWKVKIATNKDSLDWSQPQRWTMGLMDQSDWQTKWTGLDKSFEGDTTEGRTRLAARYFRKEVDLKNNVKKATLYISGLGLYEAYINGKRIGTQVLAPTPTDYNKSVKYNSFDVTKELQTGNNALGITLGNGRYFSVNKNGVKHYGFPKMILQLEVEYKDNTTQTIVADDSWKVTADGPIRANNEFDGEDYNANMEMPNWNKVGFDDTKWMQAEMVEAPSGKLGAQLNPNIQIMEVIKPKTITELKPGTYILDMGQNMVGWLHSKMEGQKDQKVQMRFAELLKDDGSLYTENLRAALATNNYTMKGDKTESWEPSFTYHGFRYVEITGLNKKPNINDFEGKVIYDEMETTGHFQTSNNTINQVYKNAYWGIRGNYRGMPTDCPQRDERMGWLGDRAVGSNGEAFIFNNNLLYSKWLCDIEETQREDGALSDVAPIYWAVYSDNMTWPAAYIIIANMLYDQFGNQEPIKNHYDSMKKWLSYMKNNFMVDNLITRDRYGDWCMPPESIEMIHSEDPMRKTDGSLLGTSYYFHLVNLMERFATILNKPEDAKYFKIEGMVVKEAFNNKFLNKKKGLYDNNAVTANILPLAYGMIPEEYKQAVFDNIVDKTMGEFNGHISTGLIGAQQLMRGLSDNGRPDIAYKLATNRDYPSWGYMVDNGATTIWELWNGNTADPAMNSANHVMLLGDLVIWYYEYLAGIQNSSQSIGFKEIKMKPYPVEGLEYVDASYQSVRGKIKSSWKRHNNSFNWEVSIPANTSAIVYIPTKDKDSIAESGENISSVEGIHFLKMEGEYAIFEVCSGKFKFTSKY